MKVVVTGGSGFVGNYLLNHLSQKHEVVNIDLKESKSGRTIVCDIRDKARLQNVFRTELKDADAVIHLAAFSREAESNEKPDIYFENNSKGTFNLLEACTNTSVRKFVFASSYLVYGNTTIPKVPETARPNPISVYAISKFLGEEVLKYFVNTYGIDGVVLRKSLIYGENDEQKRVVSLFIDRAKHGKEIILFGNKVLDFVYVKDVVEGYARALDVKGFDIFNLGSGIGISFETLAAMVRQFINPNVKIVVESAKIGEVTNFVADISKARRYLDFDPQGSLEEFIKREGSRI